MDERGVLTKLLKHLAVTCNISVLFFFKMCKMMPLVWI